jgi:hypothetical protein
MALTASSHPAVRTFRSWASRQRTWNARTRSSFQTCSARGRRGAGRADYSGRRGVYHIFSLSFLCWPHTWPHTRMHTPAYTNTLTHAHLTYAHTHPPRSPVILRPRRQGWHKHAPHRRKEEKEHTCERTHARARPRRQARTPSHERTFLFAPLGIFSAHFPRPSTNLLLFLDLRPQRRKAKNWFA